MVYRFLGITPASSSLDLLFLSLGQQIAELYGLKCPGKAEEDFNVLRPFFCELLEQVGHSNDSKPPLVLILGSLDQLSPAFGSYLMSCLPTKLPAKVKLLLSVMPNYENILDRLQAKLKPSSFIELSQFSNETATTVLASLLEQSKRTLQPHQLETVKAVFDKSLSPLLLHLTALEVKKWHSYSAKGETKLCSSAYEAIHILFQRLEDEHGKTLVRHALSYLAAAE